MADQQRGFPGLDYDFEALLQRWSVPGLSLAVVHGDKVQYLSVGSAGPDKPVTSETLFAIASNSKLFAAIAVGILVDEGKFTWTTKVVDILPGFALRDKYMTDHITVRDILSHRTGLPRHDFAINCDDTTDDLVDRLKYLHPSAEPRELYQYNNFMFILAAKLVTHGSGQSFTSFVEERICKPLSMHHTNFSHPSDTLADPYVTTHDHQAISIPSFLDEFVRETNAAAGGVLSNAEDMGKWMQFLIRKHKEAFAKAEDGKASGREEAIKSEIISPGNFKEICTGWSISQSRQEEETGPKLYGHGLFITSYRGVELLTHSGGDPGYESEITWLPSENIGVAAMTNASNTGYNAASTAAYRIIDHLLRLEPVDWEARYRKKYEKKIKDQAPDKSVSHSICPTPLSNLVGFYSDPGYGSVTIAPMPDQLAEMRLPPTLEAACKHFYERISGAQSISKYEPEHPQLLVDWRRFFFSSHMVLEHVEGDTWRGTHAYIYDTKDGARKVEYEKIGDVKVRFEGAKMEWSNVAGSGEGVKPGQVDVKFEKQAIAHSTPAAGCRIA